eukprot:scaffold432634_cov55-Prasinocladus_malaysianus.AAC.1
MALVLSRTNQENLVSLSADFGWTMGSYMIADRLHGQPAQAKVFRIGSNGLAREYNVHKRAMNLSVAGRLCTVNVAQVE